MNKQILLSLLLICTVVKFACASNELSLPQHAIGVQMSTGSASMPSSIKGEDDGVLQLYGSYLYSVNQYLSTEIGINFGTDVGLDNFVCNDSDCSDEYQAAFNFDQLSYYNYVLAVKGTLPISRHASFYGKLGGQHFSYEFSNQAQEKNKNGVGAFAELGWQYRWNIGLGMNVGVQYLDMGNIDTTTLSIGVSYHFGGGERRQ